MTDVKSKKVLQGLQTAESILKIARDLFEERGFTATTTQAVIDRAGVTKGALYHHFSSKVDLFEAVYRAVETEMAGQIQAASSQREDPFEQLLAGCFTYLECACSNDMHQILRAEGPAALGHRKWQRIDREFGVYRLLPFLKRLQADNVLAIESAEAFAFQLTGAMNEATFWISGHENPVRALKASKAELRRLLEGIKATKA